MARIVGSPGGFRRGDVMTRIADAQGVHREAFARIPVDSWEQLCESGRSKVTSLGEVEVDDGMDVLVWGPDEGLDDARHMSAGELADAIAPCVDDMLEHEADVVRRLDKEAEEVRDGRPVFYMDGSGHGFDDVRYALIFDRNTYLDGSTYIGTLVDWGKCEPNEDCDDWLECHGIESFADVTVNLGHVPYEGNYVFLDENNFHGVKDFLVENGLAEDLNVRMPSGFCEYPMVRLTDKMMEASRPAAGLECEKEPPVFDWQPMIGNEPSLEGEDIPF